MLVAAVSAAPGYLGGYDGLSGLGHGVAYAAPVSVAHAPIAVAHAPIAVAHAPVATSYANSNLISRTIGVVAAPAPVIVKSVAAPVSYGYGLGHGGISLAGHY